MAKRKTKPNSPSISQSTLVAVAQAAQASVATVSLALNHHPRVAEATRRRIQEIANQLGYRPNPAARRLARGRFSRCSHQVDQIALVYFDRHGTELDGSYLSMLRGAEHAVSSRQATLIFVRVTTPADWSKVEQLQRCGMVDGWLVLGDVDDAARARLSDGKQPLVILGGHSCRESVCAVDVDFSAVGRMAVEKCLAFGHRRIGFVGGSLRYPYQKAMLNGFRSGVRELGLPDDESLLRVGKQSPPVTHEQRLHALLKLREVPTAIFAAEPAYGASLLMTLRQLEMDVPRDLALVGCGIGSPAPTGRSLALIELPFTDVGREGGRLLFELATGGERTARVEKVPPRFSSGWTLAGRNEKRAQLQPD